MPTGQEHAAQRRRAAASRKSAKSKSGGATGKVRGEIKGFKALLKRTKGSASEKAGMLKSYSRKKRKAQAKKANWQHEG
jgi:hypothetical protein